MLQPAKKKKGKYRKQDRIESTLTVGTEETDPYAIKPTDRRVASRTEDPAIPSYGRKLDNEDDVYNIFLQNAERADQREKERELAKKSCQGPSKPKKNTPRENGRSVPPEKDSARPCPSPKKKSPKEGCEPRNDIAVERITLAPISEIRALIDDLRKNGILRLEKIGVPEDIKEAFLMNISSIGLLLDATERIVGSPVEQPHQSARPVKNRKPNAEQMGCAEQGEPQSAKRLPKKSRPLQKEPRLPFDQGLPVSNEEPEKIAHIRKNWTLGGVTLSGAMLTMLAEVHYEKPTPIQAGTIPQILAGKDLMGQSRTGSGKTAAFMIPIIEKIESCEPGDDPVALVIVPTRELAVQIRDETTKLAHNREIAVVACYGGKPIADQIKKMQGGVDIVIGTPGRILDLAKRSALNLSSLKWVVLDEADRMLDIGFRPDIERILRQTPRERQTLLFSATLADEVVRLAQRYMTEPETCDFSENDIASDTIEQFYITVDRDRKFEALVRLLQREDPQQAIVFCRTKRGVDRLGVGLVRKFKNWKVSAIHGDLSQSSRDSIMRSFRAGIIKILVATDVVGRGIDVSGISHIINYDIPEFCDDYVHRVGRTGRMGREGVAYTLVTSEEGNELTRIEMRINRLLQRTELEGFEAFTRPDKTEKDEQKEPKAVFGKPFHRVRRAL